MASRTESVKLRLNTFTGGAPRVGALVWARPPLRNWATTVSSLAKVTGLSGIHYAGPYRTVAGSIPPGVSVSFSEEYSLAKAVAGMFEAGYQQVLLLTGPAVLPSGMLSYATEWMTEDLRIATVSFLSNSPGYLSFPHRNVPVVQHVSGDTADSLTAKLRLGNLRHPGRIHIAAPEGSATLLSRTAFSAALGFSAAWDSDPEGAVAEFALRASRRGFYICCDPLTFVYAPMEESLTRSIGFDACLREALHAEHWFFPALYDQQRDSAQDGLGLMLDYARARYYGLRILIDGSCLGPHEMGTQLLTLRLVQAFAEHPQVQWVGLSLPGAAPPPYASDLLSHKRIRLYPNGGLQFRGADEADILHRLFQPDQPLPPEWRQLSKRVVITIQDLIAYRVGAYHGVPEVWLNYRRNLANAVRQADGVVAITHDVAESIREERLLASEDRLIVAINGTDHLLREVPKVMPPFMAERGWAAVRYALVLGTDYAHKNRDLAIRVFHCLKQRGYPLRLILVGACVPFGSSRNWEAMAGSIDDDILVVPDVTTSERNWLLAHAAFVLYPTSAEGLGIVPFEAAALGTPTVSVAFGPLKELGDSDITMHASHWAPEQLADTAQQFLDDPAKAREAVANTLNRSTHLTWQNTADKLVTSYFELLARRPQW